MRHEPVDEESETVVPELEGREVVDGALGAIDQR